MRIANDQWCEYANKYVVLYLVLVLGSLWAAMAVICPAVDIVLLGQSAHTAWAHLAVACSPRHTLVGGVWAPTEIVVSAGVALTALIFLLRLKEPQEVRTAGPY